MDAAEIETATRLNLGYTIVVFNDNCYDLQSEHEITLPANTSGQN